MDIVRGASAAALPGGVARSPWSFNGAIGAVAFELASRGPVLQDMVRRPRRTRTLWAQKSRRKWGGSRSGRRASARRTWKKV